MGFFRKLLGREQPKGIDEQIGIRVLSEANAILGEIGIRPWLTDGTLLGYFREGSFIGHDIDMDLGCLISEYNDEIIPRFLDNGWVCISIFGERDCGLEFTFSKDGVKLDIFFFYSEGERLWHGAWRTVKKKERNLIKYYYEPFELVEKEFLGSRFWVPAETEKYIETKYGEGWRVPVVDWDWAFDSANAVETETMFPEQEPPFTAESVR